MKSHKQMPWNRALALSALLLAAAAVAGCGTNEESKPAGAETAQDMRTGERPIFDAPTDPNKVIVTVEGEELTQAEMDRDVQQMMAMRMSGMSPDQAAAVRPQVEEQVVESFVARTVLAAEAERQNVQVEDAKVEETMESIKARLPEGQDMGALLAQHGTTEEQLRADIRTDLAINQLLDQQTSSVPAVTEEAIAEFYEQNKEGFGAPERVRARHILIQVDEDADEETRAAKKAEAEALQQKLAEGADFAELAKEHSDCPSGQEGGDLGFFPRGKMVKPFEEAAFTQPTNTVGPVVETQFGYHVIEVLERKEAGAPPLDEVREAIAGMLENRGKREVVQTYIEELKSQAAIEYAE